MNDCFWCFIQGVCDGEGCANCVSYLSVNSEEGAACLDYYQKDVEAALKPVSAKWAQIKQLRENGE